MMTRKRYNNDGGRVISVIISSDFDYLGVDEYDLTDGDWRDTERFLNHIRHCVSMAHDFSVRFSTKPIKPEEEDNGFSTRRKRNYR